MRGKEFVTAAVLVGMTLNGCQPGNTKEQTGLTPSPFVATRISSSESTPTQTNDQIVANETLRLGIKLSDKEGMLWQTSGYDFQKEKFPINENTLQEAVKRVNTVFLLMYQSENPYFKNAVSLMDSLFVSGNLSIDMSSEISSSMTAEKAAMGVNAGVKEGKVNYFLSINPNFVLNNSNAVNLAILLTHETKHIEDSIAFQNSLPQSMSLEEKVAKDRELSKHPKSFVEEEARGLGAQALAYIYERGLGYAGGIGSFNEELAKKFIECNSDVNNPLWQKYVAELLLVKE